jgi:ADP-ribosylglycohydrolase
MTTDAADQVLKIEYSGPSRQDAEELASALAEASPVTVNQAPCAKASMATGEIVLTILASAATQAVIHVAIDRLREYMNKKILAAHHKGGKAPNMRVLIHWKSAKPIQKLISLRVATVDVVAQFIDNLGDEITKAIL